MDNWSDDFDDCSEESAANYVNGRFDPKAAEARRASQERLAEIQAKLAAETRTLAQRHRPQQKPSR